MSRSPEICVICGRKCPQKPSGRRRKYCSRACQQFAYRLRQSAGMGRAVIDLNSLLEEVMTD